MKIWFKNNITGRYLLTDAPEGYEFEYGMIGSITDRQLILPMTVFEEGSRCLSYPVSGLESIEDLCRNQWLSREMIASVMLQLGKALETLQNHLLTEQNLLIGRNSVFYDQVRRELRFLVHPGTDSDFLDELRSLLGLLVIRADREDAAAMRIAADLLQKAEDPDFCFGELPMLMDGYSNEITFREDPDPAIAGEFLTDDLQADSLDGLYEKPTDPGFREDQDPFPGKTAKGHRTAAGEGAAKNLMENPAIKNMVLRLLISQLIMLTGMGVILFLRGWHAVRHALPVYLILCVSISLYFLVDMMAEKRRAMG